MSESCLMMLAWLEEGSRGSDWYSSFMFGHEEGLMSSSSRAHPESLGGDPLQTATVMQFHRTRVR